ncbi:hypothetical protein [Actinomyces howellii]|uniref:ABC-2 family transporter protein n=1 Tax=Actinomyces howellii TaxID=52771 RepID=A0A448HEJ5_9ACTO|nr:hypothetical protein [Actinomyces howellii]VEG26635.1 Uncharacterised protein [Actinomyces howellii]
MSTKSTSPRSPAPPSAPSSAPEAARPAAALATVGRVARIGLGEQRTWLTALPVAVGLLTAVLAPSYGSTYATAADLARAVASARLNTTSTFLYGTLPEGADVVQLTVWELGALTCLVLGVVIVLRAVAASRAAEEAGRAETLRAVGAGAVTQLAGSALVLGVQCLGLGAGAGAGLLTLARAGTADALAYGAAVALTCALAAAGTLLVCQLLADATAARGACLVLMALLFAWHGAACAEGWGWAGACFPFSLRGEVDPGGLNDLAPLAVAALALAALLVAAGSAAAARDLGAGLVRPPRRTPRPLRVRGPLTLAVRLCRYQALAWAAGTAAASAVLTTMGQDVVTTARQGGLEGGSLGSLLSGEDPGTSFLRYIGTLVGCLAASQAVALCGRPVADERAGRLEAQRATGTGSARILVSWWGVGVLAAGVTLAVSTMTAGWAGVRVLGTSWADAVRLVGGQLPAALAAAGVTTLLCGTWPRGRAAAWAPVLISLGIAQLGGVLDLPQVLLDAAPLAQAGERSSLWLAGCGLLGVVLGGVGIGRRDLWVDGVEARAPADRLRGAHGQ